LGKKEVLGGAIGESFGEFSLRGRSLASLGEGGKKKNDPLMSNSLAHERVKEKNWKVGDRALEDRGDGKVAVNTAFPGKRDQRGLRDREKGEGEGTKKKDERFLAKEGSRLWELAQSIEKHGQHIGEEDPTGPGMGNPCGKKARPWRS